MSLKDFQETVNTCNRVLQIESQNPKALYRRALALKSIAENMSPDSEAKMEIF